MSEGLLMWCRREDKKGAIKNCQIGEASGVTRTGFRVM